MASSKNTLTKAAAPSAAATVLVLLATMLLTTVADARPSLDVYSQPLQSRTHTHHSRVSWTSMFSSPKMPNDSSDQSTKLDVVGRILPRKIMPPSRPSNGSSGDWPPLSTARDVVGKILPPKIIPP
ncbi:hypothetical protein PVAP13_3KG113700 [Panicum virgatum]|uniref:Uncharacterized protein n=1 Tax=Panicum virgatum TaxID=38727 RepID=A0A8T0UPJ1_PANVG|nr:hypothetical protein PVAP13_3KG113700 [Panicum virgatum]